MFNQGKLKEKEGFFKKSGRIREVISIVLLYMVFFIRNHFISNLVLDSLKVKKLSNCMAGAKKI